MHTRYWVLLIIPATNVRSSSKLSYTQWMEYLSVLSSSASVNINLIKTKLAECGPPGTNKTTVSYSLNMMLQLRHAKCERCAMFDDVEWRVTGYLPYSILPIILPISEASQSA